MVPNTPTYLVHLRACASTYGWISWVLADRTAISEPGPSLKRFTIQTPATSVLRVNNHTPADKAVVLSKRIHSDPHLVLPSLEARASSYGLSLKTVHSPNRGITRPAT